MLEMLHGKRNNSKTSPVSTSSLLPIQICLKKLHERGRDSLWGTRSSNLISVQAACGEKAAKDACWRETQGPSQASVSRWLHPCSEAEQSVSFSYCCNTSLCTSPREMLYLRNSQADYVKQAEGQDLRRTKTASLFLWCCKNFCYIHKFKRKKKE